MAKILSIETSCDETAAAVIQDGRKILSSISSVVKKFDDDTVIYPGHDREFTLKEAKENNYIIINYGLADRQID